MSIPKYATPLVIPPAMPKSATIQAPGGPIDYYEIAVRQFNQQILPVGFPSTTVWGYGSINHPATFNYPAFTIEAQANRPVRVKWINDLKDADGNFLPHLFAVDQTLHWANPPGPMPDTHTDDPTPYTGPVPLVTHVHGAHTTDDSDGYTEAWYLPDAANIGGYIASGTWYDTFKAQYAARTGITWTPGSATFDYPNDQRAATLWYHDHALGMTRLNVYAGPAGFYLIRGGIGDKVGAKPGSVKIPGANVLPAPAPQPGDALGTRYYEIPIAIQDRSFNDNGSLFYPDSREEFDGFAGPYIPDSDVSPIWTPEFFGNTMVVNGRTWPNLDVEPRRYRLRLLNGCNSRFVILKLVTGDPSVRPATSALVMTQIGAEQGFLAAPVDQSSLLMSPAERADVIVDFSGLPAGTEIFMINEGPDEPFRGGTPGIDFPWADPQTSGEVMKFTVGTLSGPDTSVAATNLVLPRPVTNPKSTATRRVALLEEDSALLPGVGPRRAVLGTFDAFGMPVPQLWMDAITEKPLVGATEIWEIHNFTMDAHPIHLHLVGFEVLDRTPMTDTIGGPTTRPRQPWESGMKDTVIAFPDEVTRVRAKFDLAGLYVWHCHIVEHEDNEMMRPMRVLPKQNSPAALVPLLPAGD